ncbi:hypothetical protein B1759_16695 [Rubrivirga sp. SAORIC476]|uniref:helix-turn-helix domain-containing protein n=1 Tax=Rubrivirga sp. SAORIC476 TaxID=1961794 RepID=UPI000BA8E655|nr:helix-turn-helix domain-containing protein [Rubrivirga sp. SAORIC476]PAP74814.1 hypothetical protein B1759_16695 [Rubrivirga sp. SAORIC476]
MEPVIVTSESKLRGFIDAAVEAAMSRLAPRLSPAEQDRPAKNWLTNREAQDYLGLSKATLARYRADGTLPYSKVGASVFYRLSEVEALLERSGASAPPHSKAA